MMANRVAVVGHSHVRRLEEHCNGDNLSLNNIQIRFFSRGGLTVPQLFDRDIFTPLLAFRPQGLVLLIVIPSTNRTFYFESHQRHQASVPLNSICIYLANPPQACRN